MARPIHWTLFRPDSEEPGVANAKPCVSMDGRAPSWFETREDARLTMRVEAVIAVTNAQWTSCCRSGAGPARRRRFVHEVGCRHRDAPYQPVRRELDCDLALERTLDHVVDHDMTESLAGRWRHRRAGPPAPRS